MDPTARIPPYAIYKPNRSGKGSTAQFYLAPDKNCMFLEMAPQDPTNIESKKMDYDKKVRIKLGVPDISAIIHGFTMKEEFKLFHKTDYGNTTLDFRHAKTDGKVTGYFMNISKKANDGDPQRVSTPLAPQEITTLKILLERALIRILSW